MCHYLRPHRALHPAAQDRRVWDLGLNRHQTERRSYPQRLQQEDPVKQHWHPYHPLPKVGRMNLRACDQGLQPPTVYILTQVRALCICPISLRQHQRAGAYRFRRGQRPPHRVRAALCIALQIEEKVAPEASASDGVRVVLLESCVSNRAITHGRKIWKQNQQNLPIWTWERPKVA